MRALCFGSALLAFAALCACGGGSTGTPPPLALPSGSAASPTPDPYPTTSGETFSYSGTMTEKFVHYPVPSASPWTSTDTRHVTQTVTVKDGATFNGHSGLTDYAAQEIDAATHATTTVTSDTYMLNTPSRMRTGGTDVSIVGDVSSDSSGVMISTAYSDANGRIDELPEAPGLQWTNTAARVETETDPDMEKSTATYADDGTYTQDVTYPEGGASSVVTYDDGSAVYQFPLQGFTDNSTLTIAAAKQGEIDGELTTVPNFPKTQLFSIENWYPVTPPVAASDSFVDEGPSTLPASCGASAVYSGPGVMKVVETRHRLDVMFGQIETVTVTTYVSGAFGTVCVITHDDLESYYDFTGQGPAAFTFQSTPVQATVVDETVALQSEKIASRRTVTSLPAVRTRPADIIAAARRHFAREMFIKLHSRTIK